MPTAGRRRNRRRLPCSRTIPTWSSSSGPLTRRASWWRRGFRGENDGSAMTIEKIAFGRTGHQSSRLLFGAAALGSVDQATADRTYETLMQHGINHIDVARSYGDAELRIAPWLKRERDHFFVATKTGARRAREARDELRQSLERMGVDHVDLWQLHNLADPIEWDTALSPGGVIEAAVEARDAGL